MIKIQILFLANSIHFTFLIKIIPNETKTIYNQLIIKTISCIINSFYIRLSILLDQRWQMSLANDVFLMSFCSSHRSNCQRLVRFLSNAYSPIGLKYAKVLSTTLFQVFPLAFVDSTLFNGTS